MKQNYIIISWNWITWYLIQKLPPRILRLLGNVNEISEKHGLKATTLLAIQNKKKSRTALKNWRRKIILEWEIYSWQSVHLKEFAPIKILLPKNKFEAKCLILPRNAFQTKSHINSGNSFQTKCLIQSNYFSSKIGCALKKNSNLTVTNIRPYLTTDRINIKDKCRRCAIL